MKFNGFIHLLLLLVLVLPAGSVRAQDAAPAYPVYVVQEGDNLWSIALRFGISQDALAEANNLTDLNNLKVGDRLIIRGPYLYSRNPQYIGDSLTILGFIVLTNSWMVAVVGFLGIFLNYLAPLTEEPWLAERFGEAYLDYKARVPRFIGRRIKKGTP